jgi:hypothetical protein
MQTVANGPPADLSGGVFRVTEDGQTTPNGPLIALEPRDR